MSMTERGDYKADILIRNSIIQEISEHICTADDFETTELDLTGLTVLPGLNDCCIRSGGMDDPTVCKSALLKGITSGVIIRDPGAHCTLFHGTESSCVPFSFHQHTGKLLVKKEYGDQIRQVFLIHNEDDFEYLSLLTKKHIAFIVIAGDIRSVEPIVEAALPVVIGNFRREEALWRVARELDEAGIPIALSGCDTTGRISTLRECAGLCAREGMPRSRALRTITYTPAQMLHLQSCGWIGEGACADLNVYDGDPLLMATQLLMTISKGNVIG